MGGLAAHQASPLLNDCEAPQALSRHYGEFANSICAQNDMCAGLLYGHKETNGHSFVKMIKYEYRNFFIVANSIENNQG